MAKTVTSCCQHQYHRFLHQLAYSLIYHELNMYTLLGEKMSINCSTYIAFYTILELTHCVVVVQDVGHNQLPQLNKVHTTPERCQAIQY